MSLCDSLGNFFHIKTLTLYFLRKNRFQISELEKQLYILESVYTSESGTALYFRVCLYFRVGKNSFIFQSKENSFIFQSLFIFQSQEKQLYISDSESGKTAL